MQIMEDENITSTVKAFYEKNPFPNYDDLDNIGSLIKRAREGLFAKLLDEQIPFRARILEVGCGTGQLSNFLSIAKRTVFAADISLNSLSLGQGFKEKNKLKNVYFLQMNLFESAFKAKSFDLVICNGVLHHTSDPLTGFKAISSLVKENGYILIGLYHKYGRIITDIRRFIFKLSGNRFGFLDPRLKNLKGIKRDIWFTDQYKNPHESKHTIKEVLSWFKQTGFQFVKSIPRARLFGTFSENEKLFKPEFSGNPLELFLVELGMLFTADRNGGVFIIIGQKKNE